MKKVGHGQVGSATGRHAEKEMLESHGKKRGNLAESEFEHEA